MISSYCKTSWPSWQWWTIRSSPRLSFDLGSSLSANMLDLEEAAEKSEVFNAGRRQSQIFLILITTSSHPPPLTFSDRIDWNRRALRLSWLKDLKNKTAALWQLLLKAPSFFWEKPWRVEELRVTFQLLEGRETLCDAGEPSADIRNHDIGGERESALDELLCFTQWQPKSNIRCCTEAPLQCVVWSSLFKKAEAHVNRNPLAASIGSSVHASFHYR